MDGLSAVQSRISEIRTMFAVNSTAAQSSSWSTAASAAGLDSTSSTSGSSTTTTSSTTTGSGSAVVAAAEEYLGVPYEWGGTDSSGLDCSGLVQLVYSDLGIDLPRTSSQQATSGQAVASLDEAQPGDLVFYDYDSSRAGIDHVGIYIGNGQMIAAPEEGEDVQVQSVGNPTVIRRIVSADGTALT